MNGRIRIFLPIHMHIHVRLNLHLQLQIKLHAHLHSHLHVHICIHIRRPAYLLLLGAGDVDWRRMPLQEMIPRGDFKGSTST